MIRVDLVIPVLNEEETIFSQVEYVLGYFEHLNHVGVEFNLVIADNGSTDSTPELAERLVETYSDKLRIERVSRPGVGLALKHAWIKSDADWVGYMDLDLATDLVHLNEVVSLVSSEQWDLIYGSRLSGSSVVKNRSFFREITSRIFNFILRFYLRVNVKDGMCGFKFVRRALLDEIIERGADSDGWFFCAALLVVGEHSGFRLKELPVMWTDDPNSKVKAVPLAIRYLKEMKRLKSALKTSSVL